MDRSPAGDNDDNIFVISIYHVIWLAHLKQSLCVYVLLLSVSVYLS